MCRYTVDTLYFTLYCTLYYIRYFTLYWHILSHVLRQNLRYDVKHNLKSNFCLRRLRFDKGNNKFFKPGLIQCITAPTHAKGNILGILLTNSESLLNNVQILSNCEICKSDHYAITFDLKLKIAREKPVKTQRFNFKKANWDNLNTELNNVNWISVLDCLEPDIAWLRFKDILNSLLHIHIPKVTVKLNSQPPWFDTECYLKCKEKEGLHKKYKSTKSIQDELKFSLCRKEFKNLLRSKMRDNLYCSNDRNVICKQFWSHVKTKSRSNRIPEVMKHEGSISSQSTIKANMFNDYFHKQFSHSSTYDTDVNFSNDELFDIDFSCTRIKQLLDEININKAAGPDGIPGYILKHCSIRLCRPLSIIYKLIYNTGIIPQEWKSANIVPIHKKGDKSLIENYRPISLLCLSSKIMERVTQDELLNKTREFLNPMQHGFLPGKSCTTNLITLTDNIARNLSKDFGTDIIYFDFTKALDTVNHGLLIAKLKKSFKVEGRLLKLIINYLKDRQQRVVLDNSFSEYQNVTSGVPKCNFRCTSRINTRASTFCSFY